MFSSSLQFNYWKMRTYSLDLPSHGFHNDKIMLSDNNKKI